MSSHHIVRSRQEPALIILSLETVNDELLGQMLEWSPTVLVDAAIYESVDSLGIKIDHIAGIYDGEIQGNTDYLAGADALTLMLDFLVDEDYPAVNILADTIPDTLEKYWESLNIVIIHNHRRSFMVKTGFKVWKPAGTRFHIVQVPNLNVSNCARINGALFEVVKDDFVQVDFSGPRSLLTEEL